jgi:hypothetical protein
MWNVRLMCLVAVIVAVLLNGGWSALDAIYGGYQTLAHTVW